MVRDFLEIIHRANQDRAEHSIYPQDQQNRNTAKINIFHIDLSFLKRRTGMWTCNK